MWLHRFSVFTAVFTLPLIFIGGLVTSHDAALAVPDWPTSYGYNMFFFPWDKMIGGIFYEHSHRLVASLVGFLTIILAVWLQLKEPRKWVRQWGWIVLALVVFQGVLGGLRVVLLKKEIAVFHACLAQTFFCLVAAIALFTSDPWKRLPKSAEILDTGSFRKWIILTTLMIFIQLIFGAVMRHTDSGLAVPDFPLIYGKVLPPINTQALEIVNHQRIWQWGLDAVSFKQIAVHLAHRLWAGVVAFFVLKVLWIVRCHYRHCRIIQIPVFILTGFLVTQIMIGILVVWTGKAADIATFHVAVGALTLMTSFLLTLISFKVLIPLSQDLTEITIHRPRLWSCNQPAVPPMN